MRAKKTETGVRQEQIAQAALDLIGSSGIRALSIANVAQKVGIVPSGIYRHFSSMDELLNATLELIGKKLAKNIEMVMNETSDPVEQLRLLMIREAEMLLANQAIPHIVFSESIFTDSDFRKSKVQSIMQNYLKEVSMIVQTGQESGCFRTDLEPSSVALMFKGLMLPSIILLKASGDKIDLLKHFKAAWKCFYIAVATKN